jgi:predicted nucleic acid-binding protein
MSTSGGNILVYAVGREHPLRETAQMYLRERLERNVPMLTSAEVLQELLHVYLPVGRLETLRFASPRTLRRRCRSTDQTYAQPRGT